jgi:hypothetical protein
MNISLTITKEGSENQGQGTTLSIPLKVDVTLFQARALAKRIKQLSEEGLTVSLFTDEEVVQIK